MESDSKLSRLSIINKIETKSIAAYFTIVFIYNFEQLYAFWNNRMICSKCYNILNISIFDVTSSGFSGSEQNMFKFRDWCQIFLLLFSELIKFYFPNMIRK